MPRFGGVNHFFRDHFLRILKTISITINGETVEADAGSNVASALLNAGVTKFRTSVVGEARAPFCGMGICYECRVTIDGVRHEKSCQIPVREAMIIETYEDD